MIVALDVVVAEDVVLEVVVEVVVEIVVEVVVEGIVQFLSPDVKAWFSVQSILIKTHFSAFWPSP